MNWDPSLKNKESILITGEEKQMCLLVEEAKECGVIDFVCSRTVAGVDWMKEFIEGLTKGITIELRIDWRIYYGIDWRND